MFQHFKLELQKILFCLDNIKFLFWVFYSVLGTFLRSESNCLVIDNDTITMSLSVLQSHNKASRY